MTSKTRVGMDYIKVILLVNIGLTFAIETINPEYDSFNYFDEDAHTNAKIIFDEYLQKNVTYLSDNVYPKHYAVKLGVDTQSSYPIISLEGEVDINVTIVKPTRRLFLHAKNIKIDDFYTTLNNNTVIYYVEKSYKINEELVAIQFKSKIPSNHYTLRLVFDSSVNDSFFRNELPTEDTTFGLNSDLLLTQFGKFAARHLFPCWDDPAFKTTFDITIKHESKYTVLSNMPVLDSYDANDVATSMKWTKFDTTPIISTDQLVLLFKPYNLIEDPKENVYTWRKSDRTAIISRIHDRVDDVLQSLEKYLNISLKDQKLDHVLVPNAPYSEAHLGLVIYRESDVIYDENKDPNTNNIEVTNTIESLIARQLFGGLVSPKSWDDSWLIESFVLYFSHYSFYKVEMDVYEMDMKKNDDPDAIWCSYYINLRSCPKAYRIQKHKEVNIVENYFDIMHKDNGSMPPVFEMNRISSLKSTSDVQHKGALILHMLSGMMGEEFPQILQEYLTKHKYGLITSDNFCSFLYDKLQTSFDQNYHLVGQTRVDIREVVNSWIKRKGLPEILVQRDYTMDNYVKITIANDAYNDGTKWFVPVSFMKQLDDNTINISFFTWAFFWVTSGIPIRYQLGELANDKWFIVNLQRTGYYRVHYDRKNWQNLANYLHHDEYLFQIPPLNRAQLIDDICDNFNVKNIYARYVDWELFSYVTGYLNREEDITPWVSMLKCLDMMSIYFPLPESKEYQDKFASFFRSILPVVLEIDTINEFGPAIERKQNDILFYACTLGNSYCRKTIADKLKRHLKNPTIYKIFPWQNWMFCSALKVENGLLWNEVLSLYIETENKAILNSFPCLENDNITFNFLYHINNVTKIGDVSKTILIEEADKVNMFNSVIKQHINNERYFSRIMEYIKEQRLKYISINDAIDTIIANIYSEDLLDKLYSILMTIINDSDIYEAHKDKIERRRREIQILKRNFDALFKTKIHKYY